MQMRQKCAMWKNRKIPISAETQPSAAVTCVKPRSYESAVKAFFVLRTKNHLFSDQKRLLQPGAQRPVRRVQAHLLLGANGADKGSGP